MIQCDSLYVCYSEAERIAWMNCTLSNLIVAFAFAGFDVPLQCITLFVSVLASVTVGVTVFLNETSPYSLDVDSMMNVHYVALCCTGRIL